MPAVDKQRYLASVRERVEADGFEVEQREGMVLWAHRRKFRPSRFGFEDASVAIAELAPGAGATELESLADRALQLGLDSKVGLVRGFGSFVLVYPVALVERASSALAEAARARRKHWALEEYRVLVELGRRGLTSDDERKIWGAAYFKSSREQALHWLRLSA